jgi:hypothetical protein
MNDYQKGTIGRIKVGKLEVARRHPNALGQEAGAPQFIPARDFNLNREAHQIRVKELSVRFRV